MPRIRSIHPQFWSDEKIAELPFGARLLFIGTWNFADDEGRLEDNPRRLRLQIFPGGEVKTSQVDEWLNLLAEDNRPIIRYEVNGRLYLQVRKFTDYQSPSRPTKSKLPPPPPELLSATQVGLREAQVIPVGAHGAASQERDRDREGSGTPISPLRSKSGPPGPSAESPVDDQVMGYGLSLPVLEERMGQAKSAKAKVGVLVDFVRAHGPTYAGTDLGDRAAGLLRGVRGDGRRALALLLRALAQKPDGDLFSYAQAIAGKEPLDEKPRGTSPGGSPSRRPGPPGPGPERVRETQGHPPARTVGDVGAGKGDV